MVAPAFETLPSNPEQDAACGPDDDSQVLVLDLTGETGSRSILLDQPRQLIGWDVECSIQLPDSGVHARHAVILRGQRQVVVKAWDPRTWLNGNAVTESPLSPGDLLKVGPVEFRVRAATADELIHDAPASGETAGGDERFVPADWLASRRTRLAAIRAHLKERRAELDNEFRRLHSERAQFERERLTFQSEREKAAARAQLPAQNKASEQIEPTDNVSDYMQQLLKRMRAERPGDYSALSEEKSPGSGFASDGVPPSGDTAGDSPTRKTRRVHDVNEVRAGVGTLREIANFSARVAVATHSSRKLRRSVATTLPLAFVSFVLAALLMLVGGDDARYYGQAFGMLMLGVIVGIEMLHSFWKIRRLERVRTRPVNQAPADAAKEESGADASTAASACPE
jgi:hypothetical protein